MTEELVLVPMPQSVQVNGGVWNTDDPWSGLTVELSSDLDKPSYTLNISPAGAHLRAGSEAAIADGRNTFAQIVAGAHGQIPCVSIEDRPEFAWRGMHVDVSRHFFELEDLRTLIDAMALHRLNVLHLHLTDDQGWRVEIKGYPKLTEIGAYRAQTLVGHMGDENEDATFDGVPHGGFYTQDQLRELVAYASNHGVMIVPEIDLPGHMQAAIAAYPELGNDPNAVIRVRETWGISDHVLGVSDTVFTFIKDVLEQVADIFPAPFFHIGGDECPQTEWEQSEAAHARLEEWGLTRISEIQGRFTFFAAEVLRGKGKRVVAWDEALESPLPDDVVIMNWRKPEGVKAAVDRGFQTIVATSDVAYFDHYQANPKKEPLAIGGLTTVRDVYTAALYPEDLSVEQRSLILGVQGQLWTEYITTPSHLQYMAFPRMCALAERAWGSPAERYRNFEKRLSAHLPQLDRFGVNYRPLD